MQRLLILLILLTAAGTVESSPTYSEWKGSQDWSKLQFKENTDQFDFNDPVSTTHWVLFWTLQVLDVYTTYEGLKCDNVTELNPFFPDQPRLSQIILTKALLLSPLIYTNNKYKFSNKQIILVTGVTALAVLNNNQVMNNTTCN